MTDLSRNHAPVLEKMYQLVLWLAPTVDKFPRAQKFLIGDRIQTTALNIILNSAVGKESDNISTS